VITLSIDLATVSTGWAVFKGKKLEAYGQLAPTIEGISKMKYPEKALHRIVAMAAAVRDLVAEHNPDELVIEEVNRGVSRISQKSLDAVHFFVLEYLKILHPDWPKEVKYMDSNGKKGWRGALKLYLSAEDKKQNAVIRKENKKSKVKRKVINAKTLSIRYVNKKYKLQLNEDVKGDPDKADAICVGIVRVERLI